MARPLIRATAALVGGAFALTGCVTPPVPSITYVGLGDSYASMGSREEGLDFCARSSDNYAALLGADPRIDATVDVSCQGAVTMDLLGPRAVPGGELPAQLEALRTDTDLVTVSIGGNDIGFGEIVGCVTTQLGGPPDSDCASALGPTIDERLAALPAALAEVHAEIAARSPDAEVITVGYLPALRAADDCTALAGLSGGDKRWLVAVTDQLNSVARKAADSFIAVDGPGVCAPPAERHVDLTGEETGSFPVHPTPAGHAAVAETLLAELS